MVQLIQAGAKHVRIVFQAEIEKDLAEEIKRLGAKHALILATPQKQDIAMKIAKSLGPFAAGVYCKAEMHTPVHVTEAALDYVVKVAADCLISIGGGSTIGLGKAIAFRCGLQQIVIPTTYAGSEATPILGQTEDGVKTTFSDPRVLPKTILYDPKFVATLPVEMTITSALNAIAHAAEALYAVDRTSKTTQMAINGMQAFADSLLSVIELPSDLTARAISQRGAWACGTVLGQVSMSLHHKLCHTLGGSFNLPHAETHAVMLPHAIAYNARVAAKELEPICKIFGGDNAGTALYDFARKIGAPLTLRELGLNETDLDRAAELAVSKPYPNPQPVTHKDIRALLQNAWIGNPPLH